MKGFIQLLEEKKKTLAMLFGRMNPPTAGHEDNVNGLKKLAKTHRADHLVIASHSHDAKKNPLDAETKMKHLKRAFPDTNVTTSSKEKPTILHHASEAHKKGYTHLVVAGGGDRAHEYHKLLNRYNGVTGHHGYYKFDHISVKSTGERKKGVSGTDMRKHAQEGNYEEFKKHAPSHISKNEKHAKELYHDTRAGLGIHEDTMYGKFKAIFITGGPGSGKDIVIREAIAAQHAVELNTSQMIAYLGDKQKLSEASSDIRREAIRNRSTLIINGTADNYDAIDYIKEELEELGYSTMMVYVDTTNGTSILRNEGLRRMVAESVRLEKWQKAQVNKIKFHDIFDDFNLFENNSDLTSIEESITDVCGHVTEFLNNKNLNESAANWLLNNHWKMMNLNEQAELLIKLDEGDNDDRQNKTVANKMVYETRGNSKRTISGLDGSNNSGRCRLHNRFINENNCPTCQIERKKGKIDSIKDGDVESNSSYIFKTYEEKEGPSLKTNPEPKVPAFQKDKEVVKARKSAALPNPNMRVRQPGIGPEYDTRGQGTVYPMSGLGNMTYREQVDNKYKQEAAEAPTKKFSEFRVSKVNEAIDDPGASDMGVSGTAGNATAKEPMETLSSKTANVTTGIKIRKKKRQGEE